METSSIVNASAASSSVIARRVQYCCGFAEAGRLQTRTVRIEAAEFAEIRVLYSQRAPRGRTHRSRRLRVQ